MPLDSSLAVAVPEQKAVSRQYRHIWIITGPAGCGKSTVASHLATQLNLPYVEGDEYHPPANIEKMSNGIPLTDADRWDWLILLRQQAIKSLNIDNPGVVVACSALKQKYRDVIRIAAYHDPEILVQFIYLSVSQELLLSRVAARQGHYMKDSMVKSQFLSLEPPMPNERDIITVDGSGNMDTVQRLALSAVQSLLDDGNLI